MKKIIKNFIFIIFPLVLGAIVAFSIKFDNYNVINKPLLSPPKIAFPIVWSILYLLMGISFNLVNNKSIKSWKNFGISLILNLIWPILFFKFKLYIISAAWIIILEYFVIKMIVDFYNIKKSAGLLQIPYFIWLLIALYLNIGVALLN